MSKIICITPLFNDPDMNFDVIDIQTFKAVNYVTDGDFLLPKIQLLLPPLEEIKGVLFRFIVGDYFSQGKLAEFLENFYYKEHKIPFYCCSWDSLAVSSALFAIIDEFNDDDIFVENMEIIFCLGEDYYRSFNVIKYKKYHRINSFHENCLSFVESEDIVTTDKIPKIFITCSKFRSAMKISEEQKKLQQEIIDGLKTKNIVIFTKDVENYLYKAMVAKVLSFVDKKMSKFIVSNTGFTEYAIGISDGGECFIKKFQPKKEQKDTFCIKISANEIVPSKKSFVNYQKLNQINFYELTNPGKYLCTSAKAFKDIGNTVTLSVNKYFVANIEIEKTNKNTESGAIITFSWDKVSVEIFKNGNIIDIGIKSIPMMISFAAGRIQIGKEAEKTLKSFVIFDLMKIHKTLSDNVKADPKWGFKLIKESNQILLEFDTFRGRRKASPEFLMAFFIKWAVKNVELITKEMPKTIVIVSKIFNDRTRNFFMEACKHAKLELKNVQIHQYKIVEI